MVALAAYYALFGGQYSALDLNQIHGEIADLTVEVEELRMDAAALSERAELLEHDARTLETLAREDFGLIREGEILYRFADSGDEEDEAP
jgi:cell division protein FtsB